MEIVFRSSFLLALTCSKRICFPPDTDSFLCVKEWGWSIWGPVPGGAGLTSYTGGGGALGGGTPPPVRAAAGPFGACGAKASAPGCVYQPTFVSGRPGPRLQEPLFSCRRISVASRFRLFHINEEGLLTAPLCLRAEWKNQKKLRLRIIGRAAFSLCKPCKYPGSYPIPALAEKPMPGSALYRCFVRMLPCGA